jgi:hypothetical protein
MASTMMTCIPAATCAVNAKGLRSKGKHGAKTTPVVRRRGAVVAAASAGDDDRVALGRRKALAALIAIPASVGFGTFRSLSNCTVKTRFS